LFFSAERPIVIMREIVHLQAGQCGNQIGAKVKPARYRFPLVPVGPDPRVSTARDGAPAAGRRSVAENRCVSMSRVVISRFPARHAAAVTLWYVL